MGLTSSQNQTAVTRHIIERIFISVKGLSGKDFLAKHTWATYHVEYRNGRAGLIYPRQQPLFFDSGISCDFIAVKGLVIKQRLPCEAYVGDVSRRI